MLVLNLYEKVAPVRLLLVSILVLMDVGLKLFLQVIPLTTLIVVSILVLMDVGLKHSQTFLSDKPPTRFNPCFDGCWS